MVNGQKTLTITMTPSILPMVHGQIDHLTTVILEFWPWSWSKMAIFDHLTTAILKFWPWSWSKIFDHLTMTRRPNGQKIVVVLPPPPPKSVRNLFPNDAPSYGYSNDDYARWLDTYGTPTFRPSVFFKGPLLAISDTKPILFENL